MNAEELWETTMDPARRVLLQVTLDDAAAADEIFAILMGEDVESRRGFIQRNARTSVSWTSEISPDRQRAVRADVEPTATAYPPSRVMRGQGNHD